MNRPHPDPEGQRLSGRCVGGVGRDVGKALVYMASLPLEANVLFMTVMASAMPFVGRG